MRKLAIAFLVLVALRYLVLPFVLPLLITSEQSFWAFVIISSMIAPLILPCAITAAIVYLICTRKSKA